MMLHILFRLLLSCYCLQVHAFVIIPRVGQLKNHDNNQLLRKAKTSSSRYHVYHHTNKNKKEKITTIRKTEHFSSHSNNCDNVIIEEYNSTILKLPLHDVTSKLHRIINQKDKNQTIATEGYIIKKRPLGSALAFIDLFYGNEQNMMNTPPLQVLLKRQSYNQNNKSHSVSSSFKSIIKSLLVGTKLYLEGYAASTNNPGEVVLLVSYIKFLQVSRNPQHVKGILMRLDVKQKDTSVREANSIQSLSSNNNNMNKLVFDEVKDAFFDPNDAKNMGDRLKQVLLGELDPDCLFNNNDNENNHQTGSSIQTKFNNEIPNYVKISKLIVSNLPKDEYYPSIIINSNGYDTNTLQKHSQGDKNKKEQKSSFPQPPSNIKKVPMVVVKEVESHSSEEKEMKVDYNVSTIPIHELLDKAVSTSKTKNDNNNNNNVTSGISSPSYDKIIQEEEEIQSITICGWVQNRRRFQSHDHQYSIAVLELVDQLDVIDTNTDSNNKKPNRLKCVIHPDCIKKNEDKATTTTSTTTRDDTRIEDQSLVPSDVYGNLMSNGAYVLLQGYFVTTTTTTTATTNINNDRPTLWVRKARLCRISWRPSVIRYFLDLIAKGSYLFSNNEIAMALNVGHPEAIELVDICKQSDTTERQWRAAELSRNLQDSNSRTGHFSDQMKQVLKQYMIIREQYPLERIDDNDSSISSSEHEESSSSSSSSLKNNVTPIRRQLLLRKSKDGSKWNSKKRPQVEWMVKQIQNIIETHPEYNLRPLNILDIGGGRGHLSSSISKVFGDNIVKVHVIDIDQRTIKNGKIYAKRKGINNIQFHVGDASQKSSNIINDLLLQSSSSSSSSSRSISRDDGGGGDDDDEEELYRSNATETMTTKKEIYCYDIIIALHACGALSDVALGHAVVNNASFVIAPCCFRSNPELKVSLVDYDNDEKDGNNNNNIKLVQPSEWLGMKEIDMITLGQAAEIQGDIRISGQAIHTLCALRAKAVEKHFHRQNNNNNGSNNNNNNNNISVGIKTFPIEYSTRNYVLVGKKM